MSVQAIWGGAAAAVIVAIFAGWREHRRRTRADLDRVGVIDWVTVQAAALIALGILVWTALSGRQ